MDVTQSGMDDYQKVLNDVFAYLRATRKDGISLQKYDELRNISVVNFVF
jgi:secreted Zn-dependent insulinase-like peptidase